MEDQHLILRFDALSATKTYSKTFLVCNPVLRNYLITSCLDDVSSSSTDNLDVHSYAKLQETEEDAEDEEEGVKIEAGGDCEMEEAEEPGERRSRDSYRADSRVVDISAKFSLHSELLKVENGPVACTEIVQMVKTHNTMTEIPVPARTRVHFPYHRNADWC